MSRGMDRHSNSFTKVISQEKAVRESSSRVARERDPVRLQPILVHRPDLRLCTVCWIAVASIQIRVSNCKQRIELGSAFRRPYIFLHDHRIHTYSAIGLATLSNPTSDCSQEIIRLSIRDTAITISCSMQTSVSYLLICKFLFQQYGVILQKNRN